MAAVAITFSSGNNFTLYLHLTLYIYTWLKFVANWFKGYFNFAFLIKMKPTSDIMFPFFYFHTSTSVTCSLNVCKKQDISDHFFWQTEIQQFNYSVSLFMTISFLCIIINK